MSIWPFAKREPKPPVEPWHYLGWTEMKYAHHKDRPDEKLEYLVHLWARGEKLAERKVTWEFPLDDFHTKNHDFYQMTIIPWINGSNIWTAIKSPSDWFIEWTKEKCGFEWVGKTWVQPALKCETDENIISFPKKSA